MLMILSPAKTLDFESSLPTRRRSTPAFSKQSSEVISSLLKLSRTELAGRMKLKPELAETTHRQYSDWQQRPTVRNARPAVLAYRGNAYVGLDASGFSDDDFVFAQDSLRILSGLYGILRPLDLIQPYRLEMAMKLETSVGATLYDFWTDTVTGALARQLKRGGDGVLVNLASGEYSKAGDFSALGAEMVTASFLEDRDGRVRPVSAFAKKARGLMASYVIRNRLTVPAEMKSFDLEGYRFDGERSSDVEYVFTRSKA